MRNSLFQELFKGVFPFPQKLISGSTLGLKMFALKTALLKRAKDERLRPLTPDLRPLSCRIGRKLPGWAIDLSNKNSLTEKSMEAVPNRPREHGAIVEW
jgi:hypothetical protein